MEISNVRKHIGLSAAMTGLSPVRDRLDGGMLVIGSGMDKRANKSSAKGAGPCLCHGTAPTVRIVSGRRRVVTALALLAALFPVIAIGIPLAGQPSPDRNLSLTNDVVRPIAAPVPVMGSLGVGQALMVTVDLDFGPKPISVGEALKQVERRYEPDDGVGRTFAVIEAFGELTPEGKLRLSMKVSTEKAGVGAMIFQRTGETLWRSRISPGTNSTTALGSNAKNLTVLLDNLHGQTWVVDGASNPSSVLGASLRGLGVPVSAVWEDGAEMEANFIYSACGCPVKVRARRSGERTVRTKELPVIFPDDPVVVPFIAKLMGW